MPGRNCGRVRPTTLITSEATTKNQPPDTLIMVFHSSEGVAKGTSSFQNFCQPDRRICAAASVSSLGMVVSEK